MTATPFAEPEAGVFVVRYGTPEDLAPDRQKPLTEAIVRKAATHATGVVFVLDRTVRSVEMAVPTFWLEFTGRKDTGLKAMAIVTSSRAVRVAVKGFAMANTIRGLPLEVNHFEQEADALAWTLERVRARRT